MYTSVAVTEDGEDTGKKTATNGSAEESHFGLVRAVLVGSIGAALEWYDFALYGFFAMDIGEAFFPAGHGDAQVLGAFAAFGSAFFMRPLGGFLFGVMGDRYGRVPALRMSIALMMLATFALGVLPPVAIIGKSSTVLLVVARLLQGLSCGGQLVGSYLFVLERAPLNRRCTTAGSLAMSGSTGTLCASLVGAIVRALCPSGYITAGAYSIKCWRLPFVSGLIIFIIGALLSTDAEEAPEVTSAIAEGKVQDNPCREVVSNHKCQLMQGMFVDAASNVGFYATFVWLPTYLHDLRPPPRIPEAFVLSSSGLGCLVVLLPMCGITADINPWGYERQMVLFGSAIVFVAPIAFKVFEHGSSLQVVIAQMMLALLLAAFGNGMFPWLVQRVPDVSVRYVTMGVGVNLNAAIFGGLAPLVATRLARIHGSFAVGLYVSVGAFVSVAFIVEDLLFGKARERSGDNTQSFVATATEPDKGASSP